MNFDDYMKKIQYISNILEKNEYAENVLNSNELDIAQDFQYICLSSAANYKLVNEIIARLAQNGNEKIVRENVKMISMSMWKDLFDQNEAIKKIFIENYSNIFENSTIITIREIERFINDKDTCVLIYNTLDSMIKKLCTYDRASLISILKTKENGIEKIRENLENFFQKGEFDITTTYSKILNELGQIPEISKIEILKVCDKNLLDMLNRETAVDNETNKLLNWLYDAYEETPMIDEDRKEIKKYIDEAIMKNFDHILDKSNYDKNTIKILKQFDCTKEKFENNKNHFIEKANRANNEEKEYYFNINGEKKNNIININEVNKIDNQKEFEDERNVLNENIQNLVSSNIQETDKIIDRVMKRSSYDTNINESKLNNSEISYNTNKMTDEQLVNAISELLKIEKTNTMNNECNLFKNNTNNYQAQQSKNDQIFEYKNEKNNEQLNIGKDFQLTVVEEDNYLIEEKRVNFIRRLWRKIVNLFKSKNSTERIGE